MPRINRIHFRLTNDEYDKLKQNLKAKGYSRVSDYLRYLALEHDRFMQAKVFQIDQNVRKILELVEKTKNKKA